MRPVIYAVVVFFLSFGPSLADYNQSKGWFYSMDWRERVRVQFLLVFTGDYASNVDGAFGRLTYDALTTFQKHREFFPNGVLDEEQVGILRRDGLDLIERVGFESRNEAATGLKLGLPAKLFEPPSPTRRGNRWRAVDDSIELETLQVPRQEIDYKALYERLSRPGGGRTVVYKFFRNDFFVVSGQLDGRDFYLRMLKTQTDSRGFSLIWDAKHAVFMDRVAIAMSNSMTVYDGGDDNALDAVTSAPGLQRATPPLGDGQTKQTQPATGLEETSSTGSGYFVTAEGHIGTNAHVAGNCRALEIPGYGSASLIKADPQNDIAILQLDSRKSDHFAQFRAGQPVVRGEEVFVLGYPFAQILNNNLNFTQGMVSSLAGIKGDERQFMLSAPVQPGNSGGPVLDRTGAVIGTVVSRLDKFKTLQLAGDLPENINFAIRGKLMAEFMQSLGLSPSYNTITRIKSPTKIDEEASQYTVLVLCKN
ncbi:serine protease [Roseibium sp. M-1]